MSVRAAGSSRGLDSNTQTGRPPRATFAAVHRPAAEAPTTMTSRRLPLADRALSSSTVVYIPVARSLSTRMLESLCKRLDLLLRPTRAGPQRKWVGGRCKYTETSSKDKERQCQTEFGILDREQRIDFQRARDGSRSW